MVARHLALGKAGEDAAVGLLVRKGYTIVARNWTSGPLELDIVAEFGGELVFIEVKTRGAGSRGTPEDGLTKPKAQRLVRAASAYLSGHDLWDRPCRFDLVTVLAGPEGLVADHLQDVIDFNAAQGGGGWQPW